MSTYFRTVMSELAEVEDLAVVVAEHGPEAAQRRGGDPDAELRDVAFQEGGDVLLPPLEARLVAPRGEGRRQSAAQPQALHGRTAHVAQAKTVEVEEGDPPGEAFAPLADQIPGGAAEDEESASRPGVHQEAQEREQLRLALDLVDDHGAAEPFEGKLRLLEPGQVAGVLEVEPVFRRQALGQSGLAGLALAQDGGDGESAEQPANRVAIHRAFDQRDHARGLSCVP
jgi:hypothetical protein